MQFPYPMVPGRLNLHMKRKMKQTVHRICRQRMAKTMGTRLYCLKRQMRKKFDLMLYGNVTEFYIVSNEPTLNVHSITVRETNQWNRMMYTLLVLIVASIDLFFMAKTT